VEDAERDVALPAEPDPRLRRAAMLFAAFGVLGIIAGAIVVYMGVGVPADSSLGGALIGYGLSAGVPGVFALGVMTGLLRGWRWARVAGVVLAVVGVLATAFGAVTLNGDVAFPFAPFLLWLPADREVARLFVAVACGAWGFAAYLLLTASDAHEGDDADGPVEAATR
jgi:hypothetical protein